LILHVTGEKQLSEAVGVEGGALVPDELSSRMIQTYGAQFETNAPIGCGRVLKNGEKVRKSAGKWRKVVKYLEIFGKSERFEEVKTRLIDFGPNAPNPRFLITN